MDLPARDAPRDRRALKAFIGCCMLYGAISGIGSNCKGIFYSAVAIGLGVPLSRVTLYMTFYGITAALGLPLCVKLFQRRAERADMI